MKKRLSLMIIWAVVSFLLFASCSREPQNNLTVESAGIPFEISIDRPITKTSLDDSLKLQWSDGDQIRIYHAVSGTEEYICDGLFTAVGDGEEVTFTGFLSSELSADEYDWYAVYPAFDGADADILKTSAYIKTYNYYTGFNQYSTLSYTPMSGKIFSVDKSVRPHIIMSHLTTMFCVNITNGLTYPITVRDVFFHGTEYIAGFFNINIIAGTYVLDGSNDNTINCRIGSHNDIQPGETARVFFVAKPFTVYPDGELILEVSAVGNGMEEKKVSFETPVAFTAGKVNTLNFTYTKEPSTSTVIVFEDPTVKACCIERFDLNYDGELSYDEAEKVSVLPKALFPRSEKDKIMSFSELEYFTALTEIEDDVFNDCENLNRIVLPDGLKKIGDSAFSRTSSLSQINLPSSVESIGKYAFSFSGLSGDLPLPVSLRNLGSSAFMSTKIESVIMNDNLETLNAYVFNNCELLSSVSFKEGLKSISDNAFRGCCSIEELVLPSGLESIGYNAFDSCIGLTEVTAPETIRTMGQYAFGGCSIITAFHLHALLPPIIYDNSLEGDYPVYVPNGSLELYRNVSIWRDMGDRIQGEDYQGQGNGGTEGIGYDEW